MLFSASSFSVGFIAGFGTGFVTREIVAAGRTVLTPVVKSAVKSSIKAVERSRETIANFGESFEDMVAEARSELGTRFRRPQGGGKNAQGTQQTKASPSSQPKRVAHGGA